MPNTLKNWQRHLCQAFGRGRLAHALLLVGDDQEGKEHAARFIAKLALCAQSLCERCNDCNQVNAGQHVNVEWVQSATSSDIRIDQVREIRDSLKLRSFNSKPRFIVFADANALTTQAANALLKSIEEPGADQYFILLASSRFTVLKTLSSRCQTVSIPPLTGHAKGEELLIQQSEHVISRMKNATLADRLSIVEDVLKYETDKSTLMLHVQKRLHSQIPAFANKSSKERKDGLLKPIEATMQARLNLERNANLQLTLENWLLNQWPNDLQNIPR